MLAQPLSIFGKGRREAENALDVHIRDQNPVIVSKNAEQSHSKRKKIKDLLSNTHADAILFLGMHHRRGCFLLIYICEEL